MGRVPAAALDLFKFTPAADGRIARLNRSAAEL